MRRLAAALAVLLLLGGAGAATAEIREVEGVGAVPGKGSGPLGADAPQDAAIRAGLVDAVRRVAEDLLAASSRPPSRGLDSLLAEDPLEYALGYRIVADRGEGPRRILDDPDVATEYVVVVEARVDADRVRRALGIGSLAGGGGLPEAPGRIFLVIERVRSWQAFAAVQAVVQGLPGVESALPVEFARGRAVLAVQARGSPRQLLDRLVPAASGRVELSPLGVDGRSVGVRVDGLASRPAGAPPGD